jgi:hypothetical protein
LFKEKSKIRTNIGESDSDLDSEDNEEDSQSTDNENLVEFTVSENISQIKLQNQTIQYQKNKKENINRSHRN